MPIILPKVPDGFQLWLPIPDVWLTEIGRVATYWSHLEVWVDSYIHRFLAQPEASDVLKSLGYKGSLAIAFNRRMRLWRTLADATMKDRVQREKLHRLIDRLLTSRDRRDTYIHGSWALGERLYVHGTKAGDFGLAGGGAPVTPESLRAFTKDLTVLYSDLIALMNEAAPRSS